MNTALRVVAVVTALLTTSAATWSAVAELPEGRWLTQVNSGVVESYRCSDALCGRLVWFRMQSLHDNQQGLDIQNPTAGLRNRPLCGLVILSGFRQHGQNKCR